MKLIRAFVACTLSCLAVPALADVWDVNGDADNDQGTDNELIHGSMQVHDLGVLAGNVVDRDWYVVPQAPQSSYEIVIDGASGDISDGGVALERIYYDGFTTTSLQTSLPVSTGLDYARSLRWENTLPTAVLTQFARVESTSCTTDCGPDDVYRIRMYETTFAIPRFNVTSSQATVLLIQNPTAYAASGRAYFWNASGTLEWTEPFDVDAHELFSLNLLSRPALANKSGTITISHNARYGDLVGKSVAIEPATGFSFDTPMVWRPR